MPGKKEVNDAFQESFIRNMDEAMANGFSRQEAYDLWNLRRLATVLGEGNLSKDERARLELLNAKFESAKK